MSFQWDDSLEYVVNGFLGFVLLAGKWKMSEDVIGIFYYFS